MKTIEIIILGIIQGLTEFIPISSSGHLDIIPRILGWENPSTILILFLHIGTLLALLVYYRKLIFRYFKIIYRKLIKKEYLKRKEERDLRIIRSVVIAVLPALFLGAIFENLVSNFYDNETNLRVIAPFILIPLIFFGVLFLFEEKVFRNNKGRLEDLTKKNALIVGSSQAIAFVRGVSRSGISLLAGQAAGLKRVEAAEFSFLISIPILCVTSLYSLYKLISTPSLEMQTDLNTAFLGMIAAFISGLLAVSFLLKFLKTNSLKIFGIYRIIFGIVLFIIIFQ